MKDWTGTNESAYRLLGSSCHSKNDREENDFYATPPLATKLLLQLEKFDKNIWEPACGLKHISNVLEQNDYNVWSTDLVKRTKEIEQLDFLKSDIKWHGDIITNPPYKYALEFVEKALDSVSTGHKVAMFLKLVFLETQKRRLFFEKNPPKIVYVSSNRLGCAINGDFKGKENIGSAVCYCWYIWEKDYKGDTILKFFN